PLELMVTYCQPEIIQHESILVVICRDEYLSQVQVLDEGVVLGAIDLDINGDPVIPRGAHGCTFLSAAGDVRELKVGPNIIKPPKVVAPPPVPAKAAAKKPVKKGKHSAPPPPPAEPKAIILPTVHVDPPHKVVQTPTLHHWSSCDAEAYLDGTSARYASITGPADLTKLGAPFGYGWYRIALKNDSARKVDVAWPECGDRLAMFLDGKPVGVVGAGPGAEPIGSLNLRKGDQTLVVLAENLGRFSGGVTKADKRGLGTHAWSVKPLRTARPALERGQPIDMLMVVSPLFNTALGDATDPSRLTWHIPGKRKTPVLVTFAGGPSRGLILVNDAPVGAFDPSGPRQLLIEHDKLGRQNNTLQLAVFGDAHAVEKQLAESVTLLDCEEPITDDAQWSFAKWEEPGAAAFTGKGGAGKGPGWFKASFSVTGTPTALRFDTHGLTKGQLYINGRHVGRYFTQTAKGHDVGPQTHMLLAAQLLHAGENTVVVFDEHGHSPAKTRLVPA
ncbi:MAG: beta galactosidase jelly roll domain-containing protein, partial [Phycisphaerales bacterium]